MEGRCVPDLIATPALDHPPVTRGGVTLAVVDAGRMTSIAPFPGQEAAVHAALSAMGLGFPAPNRALGGPSGSIVWTGRAQAFLIRAEAPALAGLAATTDQSDGWVALRLTGPAAPDVLMRLVPLDLRATAFLPGHAARSGLNHMPLILWRDETGFAILTFRSMARTAWHEIETAMEVVEARVRLAGRP
jgi:heterotetrameric sarcosine oxidase gamma subunit